MNIVYLVQDWLALRLEVGDNDLDLAYVLDRPF
jgi:hypothetical protein